MHVVAFDRVGQAPSGPEQTVATGILSPHIGSSAAGAFVAVAAPAGPPVEPGQPRWTWSDPAVAKLPDGLEELLDARLSPDGSRMAGVGLDPRPDIWSVDLQRGTKTRLTYGGPTAAPVWSGDGGEILYATKRSESYEIWGRAASATGDERRVYAVSDRHVFPSSVSRSGDVAFVRTGGATRSDVGLLRAGQSSPALIIESPFDDVAAAVSPDGSLLAYQTDESGRWEIVLVTLKDGRHSPVSSGGGTRPFWSADGKTLFFEWQDAVMAAPIKGDGQTVGGISAMFRLNGAQPVGVHPAGAAPAPAPPGICPVVRRGHPAVDYRAARAAGTPDCDLTPLTTVRLRSALRSADASETTRLRRGMGVPPRGSATPACAWR